MRRCAWNAWQRNREGDNTKLDEIGVREKMMADTERALDELAILIRRAENNVWKDVFDAVKSIKTNEKERQIMYDDRSDEDCGLQQMYVQRRNLMKIYSDDRIERDSLKRDHELLVS